MRDSYLIQRLDPPREAESLLGKNNPFAFGGGYRNGGLSDEAMDLLRPIFSFAYMGSAEFEFGAVPEALGRIANKAAEGDLEAFEFTILNSKVKKPWSGEANPPAPRSKSSIFVIAPTAWHDEVIERISAFAGKKGPATKEGILLAEALRPSEGWEVSTSGWLEIDNGYFFFTDRGMWERAAALFEIEAIEAIEA